MTDFDRVALAIVAIVAALVSVATVYLITRHSES